MNKCIDCKQKISIGHKRCLKCWHKFAVGNHASNFKQGKTLKKYYCPDCKIEISRNSNRCQSCAAKERIMENGNPNLKHGETLKKHYCIDCKINEIKYNTWYYGKKRCHSCAKKELYKNPKNHPNYINGKSKEPYTLEFTEQLKDQIRQRDNYECQNCSMTEEEHLIVIGRVLTVHHIDYNKDNCNEENLITLCNSCNIRANKNREYWKNFYQNKIRIIL